MFENLLGQIINVKPVCYWDGNQFIAYTDDDNAKRHPNDQGDLFVVTVLREIGTSLWIKKFTDEVEVPLSDIDYDPTTNMVTLRSGFLRYWEDPATTTVTYAVHPTSVVPLTGQSRWVYEG